MSSGARQEKVFAEAGFGNGAFLSTEIEQGDAEYRVPRFIRPRIAEGYYLRVWLFKTVFVLATDTGFAIKKKGRNAFKLLFGISGHN